MRNLRCALWAQENCCWLERYTSREYRKFGRNPDTCLRVALLLQAWLSIPPKMLPEILYTSTSFKSCRCQLYCIIVDSILNRQADYISSSIRLATNAPMRRKAPLGTVAGQPGLRPARMHNYTDRKKEPYLLVWFFFSNRQLSILPGRFQPSTFDV